MTSDDDIITQALNIISVRLKVPGAALNNPTDVKNFLRLKLALKEHEVFAVLFLDVKNRLISYEEMFTGTLTRTSVHPREVLKRAILLNAASVIYSHNHPSGSPDPSESDRLLTSHLRKAMDLIDVVSLDHIIVAGSTTYSFAENFDM